MRRYRGGERVTHGIYLDLTSADLFQSPVEEAVLPGESDKKYVQVPAPVALVAAPLMGLVYILFLPVLGIAGLFAFAMRQLARALLPGGAHVGRAAVLDWVPGVSYLLRGRRGRPRSGAPKEDPADKAEFLDQLEDELQERRRSGEE